MSKTVKIEITRDQTAIIITALLKYRTSVKDKPAYPGQEADILAIEEILHKEVS